MRPPAPLSAQPRLALAGGLAALSALICAVDGHYLLALCPALLTVYIIWAAAHLHRDHLGLLAQLQGSEQALRSLVEHIPDMIARIDRGLRIVYVGPSAQPGCAWIAQEHLGKRVQDIPLRWPDPARLAGWIEQVLRTGQAVTVEDSCAAGDVRHSFELRFIPEHADGEVRTVIALVRDVTERGRAEEEVRFQSLLLDQVGQSVIATDAQFNVKYWNQTATTMYGWGADEALGKPIGELMAPADPELYQGAMAAIASTGRWSGVYPVRRRDGTVLPIYATTILYRDAAGEVDGMIGVSADISELTATQEALRLSEARYRAIVESQTEQICRFQMPNCRLTFVNEAYCRAAGRSREELLGTSFVDALPPDLQAHLREHLSRLSPERPILVEEHREVQADGSVRWHEWTDQALFDADGRLVEVQSVGRDITARVAAEEALRRLNAELEQRVIERTLALEERNLELQHSLDALRRSRYLLRVIFDGLDNGLALLDQSGAILEINDALLRLIQRPADAIRSRPIGQASPSADAIAPTEWIAAIVQRQLPERRRVRITLTGEGYRMADVNLLPIMRQGQVEQLLLHVVDMTEQIQIEAQLVDRERFAANWHLAATVAHEVNSPLQAVENCLHLIGKFHGARRRQYLELARTEIQRIGRILQQLLSLYRPDAQEVGKVDLNNLIGRLLLLLQLTFIQKKIRVELQLAEGLPQVSARADELTQVLLNVIMNGVQAMPEGGTLRVLTRHDAAPAIADHPRVIVAVADTGHGIPPEIQSRLFEPFFTTKPEGSGLGLTISQKLIRSHSGTLDIRSSPGEGTTITISIPAAEDPRAES